MRYPDYSVDTEGNVWSIGYNNTKTKQIDKFYSDLFGKNSTDLYNINVTSKTN